MRGSGIVLKYFKDINHLEKRTDTMANWLVSVGNYYFEIETKLFGDSFEFIFTFKAVFYLRRSEKPFEEGVKLLNAIQDVYLCKDVTIA